jgi:hypothetical protein
MLRSPPAIWKQIATYVIVIATVTSGTIVAERWLNFPASRAAAIGLGMVMILSGLRLPRILYHTTRYMRILGWVDDDLTARAVMLVRGIGLLAMGIFSSGLPLD